MIFEIKNFQKTIRQKNILDIVEILLLPKNGFLHFSKELLFNNKIFENGFLKSIFFYQISTIKIAIFRQKN